MAPSQNGVIKRTQLGGSGSSWNDHLSVWHVVDTLPAYYIYYSLAQRWASWGHFFVLILLGCCLTMHVSSCSSFFYLICMQFSSLSGFIATSGVTVGTILSLTGLHCGNKIEEYPCEHFVILTHTLAASITHGCYYKWGLFYFFSLSLSLILSLSLLFLAGLGLSVVENCCITPKMHSCSNKLPADPWSRHVQFVVSAGEITSHAR